MAIFAPPRERKILVRRLREFIKKKKKQRIISIYTKCDMEVEKDECRDEKIKQRSNLRATLDLHFL